MGLTPELMRLYRRYEAVLLGTLGLASLAVIWEIVARLQWIDPLFISSPTQVALALRNWAVSGTLLRDLVTTLGELFIAFAASIVIGIPLGVVMGWKRPVEYAFDPFIWVLYSTPLVSFWPLFIIWLGIGPKPIIALAFLFSVVQVTINTMSGVRNIDPVMVRCARSFNARVSDLFFKFTLPGALLMIIAGLRLALGRALIGTVIGELFTSNAGLGFHISYYGAQLRFADVFAGLIMIVIVGIFTTQAMRAVEARLTRWKT